MKIQIKNILIITLIFTSCNNILYSQILSINKYIQNKDTASLADVLSPSQYYHPLPESDLPPLFTAIDKNEPLLLEFLIHKGVSPDSSYQGKTPLIYATIKRRKKIIKTLSENGADMNKKDSLGNPALFYTVEMHSPVMFRLLIEEGASLYARNNLGSNVFDYAMYKNRQDMAKYIRHYVMTHLPDMQDGPHVMFKGKKHIAVHYYSYDSLDNKSKQHKMRFRVSDDGKFHFQGFANNDTNKYKIAPNPENEKEYMYTSPEIFVMGDIHGGINGLLKILKAQNIIDKQLNWNFQDNHLVFMGDITDRGDYVTECLWLIHKLEQQAKSAGGKVHLLLGNHELLVMQKDVSYIAEKYFYLSKKFKYNYAHYFSPKSFFGRWLRTKNSVIQLDNILFAHAGLSPEMIENNYSLGYINQSIRSYLSKKPKQTTKDEIRLTGMNGPLWYRGYINNNVGYKTISSNELNKILDYYNNKLIIIGHTNVESISIFHEGKVIAVDVPFYYGQTEPAGLYILGNKIYKADVEGKRKLLNSY
ncbi:MAG: metallophosphoesterase [bacterium]